VAPWLEKYARLRSRAQLRRSSQGRVMSLVQRLPMSRGVLASLEQAGVRHSRRQYTPRALQGTLLPSIPRQRRNLIVASIPQGRPPQWLKDQQQCPPLDLLQLLTVLPDSTPIASQVHPTMSAMPLLT